MLFVISELNCLLIVKFEQAERTLIEQKIVANVISRSSVLILCYTICENLSGLAISAPPLCLIATIKLLLTNTTVYCTNTPHISKHPQQTASGEGIVDVSTVFQAPRSTSAPEVHGQLRWLAD